MAQIRDFGINTDSAYVICRNASPQQLADATIRDNKQQNDAILTTTGSLSVKTGKYTGRSPADRFIVHDDLTQQTVDWGNNINHKFEADKFTQIFEKMKEFASQKMKKLYVFDGFVGADKNNQLPIRVINDYPWQNLFARQLFIRPTVQQLENHEPEFTVMCLNDFEANPKIDGTQSTVFILINLTQKLVLIGGTRYAGEIKKSLFTVMNFLLPSKNVLPMHCSANMSKDDSDRTALFFGLSGTGKTTLSADENRSLIGDDEHGWSDDGVFNFEGGCYAKCINLTQESEPQIWNALKTGSVLENVVVDKDSGVPNFDDGTLTENTRAAYPLEHIDGAIFPSVGGHPKIIIFLTADAYGVLPPISKLTRNGAMFHFMSGYTSKLAGTERGIKEPKPVFSECFGAPFMPRPAAVYAKLLGEKIKEHNTTVYLINTGWSGGPYGIGKRIKLEYSRAMVTAALSGALDDVEYTHNTVFNLDIPVRCVGVPDDILDPKNTWTDTDSYDSSAKELAQMFRENFAKFSNVDADVVEAGPPSPPPSVP